MGRPLKLSVPQFLHLYGGDSHICLLGCEDKRNRRTEFKMMLNLFTTAVMLCVLLSAVSHAEEQTGVWSRFGGCWERLKLSGWCTVGWARCCPSPFLCVSCLWEKLLLQGPSRPDVTSLWALPTAEVSSQGKWRVTALLSDHSKDRPLESPSPPLWSEAWTGVFRPLCTLVSQDLEARSALALAFCAL